MRKKILILIISVVIFVACPALAMNSNVQDNKVISQYDLKKEDVDSLVFLAKIGTISAQDELIRRRYLGSVKHETISFLSLYDIKERCYQKDDYAFFAIVERIEFPEFSEFFEMIRKRAVEGIAAAQNNLGLMYAEGWKLGGQVDENNKLSIYWYTKAVEQGHFFAQCNLGLMHTKGQGVGGKSTENDTIAVDLFTKAVEEGQLPIALYNLALMYKEGRGVGGKSYKNNKIAFKLFKKAAEQDHAYAQYNLGKMYANGWGVEKNPIDALYWFMKSKLPSSKNGIYSLLDFPLSFSENKYSFDGKKHYIGSFKNMLDDTLRDEESGKAAIQIGRDIALNSSLGFASLVSTHQFQKESNSPDRQSPNSDKNFSPLDLLYNKVDVVEGELLELINSLKERSTPGFMLSESELHFSNEFLNGIEYQNHPRLISIYSLENPEGNFFGPTYSHYFSIGEQNVLLAGKLVNYLRTIDKKCAEADEALKEIARIYQKEFEAAGEDKREFSDMKEIFGCQQSKQSCLKAQEIWNAREATEKKRRTLETVKKRIKALPFYGRQTRNWEFFEENKWLK